MWEAAHRSTNCVPQVNHILEKLLQNRDQKHLRDREVEVQYCDCTYFFSRISFYMGCIVHLTLSLLFSSSSSESIYSSLPGLFPKRAITWFQPILVSKCCKIQPGISQINLLFRHLSWQDHHQGTAKMYMPYRRWVSSITVYLVTILSQPKIGLHCLEMEENILNLYGFYITQLIPKLQENAPSISMSNCELTSRTTHVHMCGYVV